MQISYIENINYSVFNFLIASDTIGHDGEFGITPWPAHYFQNKKRIPRGIPNWKIRNYTSPLSIMSYSCALCSDLIWERQPMGIAYVTGQN